MTPAVKFCGLTRREDAEYAVALGARYLGVVFAGGPRTLAPATAANVLGATPTGVERVGVFGDVPVSEIAEVARIARLDVVQLHAASDRTPIESIRERTGCKVWGVVRVGGEGLASHADASFERADATVVDTLVAGRLGGSGVAFDWERAAPTITRARRGRMLVLAGGLTPANVARAARALAADVVDVSSGVEVRPGIKDHALMAAFVSAAAGVAAVAE